MFAPGSSTASVFCWQLEAEPRVYTCEIGRRVPDISQKMLTQTLRAMERDGFVDRVVYAVVPPKV
ncbi:winged helix-turn-helix transcriptional regulator [Rhizobium laguerreae]|uniref:winged helix-turn-helix transcriptional regulator n=1 Tax=Rhizobium laguerreae TaxID=1076926 RepID=UPI003CCEC8FA